MAVFRRDPSVTQAKAAAYNVQRPITAAAAQVRTGNKQESEQFRARRSSPTAQWQAEAWEYFDAIGEIKYAFNLVASVVSRIRLYAAVVDDPAEAPVSVQVSQSIDPALADASERALARLDTAFGGQAGILRDAALNLSVTGECFLVQESERPDPDRLGSMIPETWNIRSVDELRSDAQGKFFILPQRSSSTGISGASINTPGVIPLPPGSFIGRVWRPHPRYSAEPDSSLRGILDLCAELLLLSRSARATERSRLNAGALYVPDGLSVAANPDSDYPYDEQDPNVQTPDEGADEFEESLIEAMTTPIEDESSAAAVVPLIIRGPAELGDKIKQFKFERSFDEAFVARADRVLERILQGLDVPKDTVTGLANVKYSNAIQIDESLYKAHIEPMLLLISDAITVTFLRPYLISTGYPEAEVRRLVIWYDPSSVATRNDRAEDADSGYDKMAISSDTWRRAHGFSDQDAPDPTEMALRLLIDKGVFSPELTEAMLDAISPDLMNAARGSSQAQSVAPVPPAVDQALDSGPAPDDSSAPSPATPDASTPPGPAADSASAPAAATPPAPSNLAEPS